MEQTETRNEKVKERLGIFLLCLILLLSGLILIKDGSNAGEIKENVSQKQNSSDYSSNDGEKPSGASSSEQASNNKVVGKININKASIEDLDTLPGIGEKTAQKIIDYRKEHGGFKTIQEIMEVSGIGEAKYNQIKNLILL